MANELSNRFNGMFHDWDHFFNDFNHLMPAFNVENQQLKSDVVDLDDHYEVSIDVPGINKKDINLNYQGDTLTVTATKHASNTEKDDEGNVITRERTAGRVQRNYYLPDVTLDKIKAHVDDGVLNITLPKSENSHKQQITID
ncbi:Hsp20/alpha crystallin family protein [Weissella fangxianensis]|uniref:Hsp20/alpha crystallin family protein n=1 Tax=Weissella fangxianensis TaxID=2953879 RepID=UPI0021584AD3|nr:Hsp20/alpha crystallin family protein [Weissella fangxianensis]